MLLKYLTPIFCIFLVCCGSFSQISTEVKEQTAIIFEGDLKGIKLESKLLSIDKVKSSDLFKDESINSKVKVKKVYTKKQIEKRIKDGLSPEYMKKIEFLKVPCEKGYNEIVIYRHDKKIFDEKIFLSTGQTRRIRLWKASLKYLYHF